MKKIVFVLSILLLSSCSKLYTPAITPKSNSSNSSNSTFTTTSFTSTVDSEDILTTTDSSSSSSEGTKENLGERDISLYALNDFHGAVKASGNEAGILKVGSFFKEKGRDGNTLIINSGDMYQGSLFSNENKGEFLTKVMNDIQFDSFTLGNHEFDWGKKYIDINRALKDENTNYSTPFLAANIYNYDLDTKTVGSYADLGEKYVIKTLENNTKVGIIGCIGKDQITSITSSYVDDYTFLDPVSVTKELSDKLRNEEGCEVVILSLHADQDVILNQGLTEISPNSNKRYVDTIFCAHSHQREMTLENGVPIIQASSNGKAYGEVKLHISSIGDVTCTSYDYPYTSTISTTIDSNIQTLYNTYTNLDSGSELLGTLDSSLSSSVTGNSVSILVCDAINWACNKYGNSYSVDYTICNQGRAQLDSGNVTYEKLFKSLPFDNDIYIGTCTGKELSNELKYAAFTRNNKSKIVNSTTYTIAVIDYLATHRNSSRTYDYFPNFKLIATLSKNGNEYNYREITRDYIKEQGSLTASDYSSTLDIHNASKKYQDIE